jgi:hypothetical protein
LLDGGAHGEGVVHAGIEDDIVNEDGSDLVITKVVVECCITLLVSWLGNKTNHSYSDQRRHLVVTYNLKCENRVVGNVAESLEVVAIRVRLESNSCVGDGGAGKPAQT